MRVPSPNIHCASHTSAPSASVPLPHHANIHLLLYTHMTSKHTLHATRTSSTKHSIRQITTHSIVPTAATTHDTHTASTGIGHHHRCLYHIMQGGWVVFREVSREICGCSDGSFFTECGLTRAISRHGRKTRLGGCHLQPPKGAVPSSSRGSANEAHDSWPVSVRWHQPLTEARSKARNRCVITASTRRAFLRKVLSNVTARGYANAARALYTSAHRPDALKPAQDLAHLDGLCHAQLSQAQAPIGCWVRNGATH